MKTPKPVHLEQKQQLKYLLRTLSSQQLKSSLSRLRSVIGSQLQASCKMISYKCYEFIIAYKIHKTYGYGRNETEAHINCIQNFLELLLEDTAFFSLIKDILTIGFEAESNEGLYKAKHHNQRPTEQFNDDTLPLEMWHDKSNKKRGTGNAKELEILTDKIANISAIMPEISLNTSKIDMGDLLSNLMENENKAQTKRKSYENKKTDDWTTKEYDQIRDKRESIASTQGHSRASTGYLSKRDTVSTQDEDRRNRPGSVKDSMRDSVRLDKTKETRIDSNKENKNYINLRKETEPKEIITHRSKSQYEHLEKDSGSVRNTHRSGYSPKIEAKGTEVNCQCHKQLLEAMSKWQKLEKEITKLSEENEALKQLLADRQKQKHKNQTYLKDTKSGSLTERRRSEVPPIPRFSELSTYRRSSQGVPNQISSDKENDVRINANREKTFSSILNEKGRSEKGALSHRVLTKDYINEHKRPSMDENTLKRYMMKSQIDKQRDGPLTERSSSISNLGKRDSSRDMAGQWTGRSNYYMGN